MTYLELKNDISSMLRVSGGKALPPSESLDPIVRRAILRVAHDCDDMTLISEDITSYEPLRFLDGNSRKFIRVPNIPTNDEDVLDCDEFLSVAIANYVVYYISHDDFFEADALKVMDDYNWKIYQLNDTLQ
jgi:hypothetical protein